MTIFEWLKIFGSEYGVSDDFIRNVIITRDINPDDDFTIMDTRLKLLLKADLIVNIILFTPSTTSSQSISHGGFQKTTGSQTDVWRREKMLWANRIYDKYDDDLYPDIRGTITFHSNPILLQ